MGREIHGRYCRRSASLEVSDWPLVANAFSGHCYAMPCQVRDETYVKVKGKWTYLYRAIDKKGKTLDFMLSERRDEAAATAFFVKAIEITAGRTRSLSTKVDRTQRACST